MSVRTIWPLIIVLMLAGARSANAVRPTLSEDLFDDAALVPADVDLYLHVNGAAELREAIAGRPIRHFFAGALGQGEISVAWEALARNVEIEPEMLFDRVLGERFTFVMRDGDGEAPAQWALLARIPHRRAHWLLRKLNAVVEPPREGAAFFRLPEHRLLVAKLEPDGSLKQPNRRSERDGVLVIGPAESPDSRDRSALLMEEIVRSRTRPQHRAGDRIADAAFEKGEALGAGHVALMVRHDPPMGGWSVAVAALHGDELTVRHAARFEHAPFTTPVTNLVCDFSPVEPLGEDAVMVIMEPADIGPGRIETWFAAMLGEPILPAELREKQGDRRFTAVAAKDGRMVEPPGDIDVITICRAVELKDIEDIDAANDLLDQRMRRLGDQMNRALQGTYLIAIDDPAHEHGAIRRLDLGPDGRALFQGLPVMRAASLNWQIIETPHGAWAMLHSDPDHLKQTAETLKRPQCAGQVKGRFQSCGAAHGPRLATLLRTVGDSAASFVAAEDAEPFSATIHAIAALAEGMHTACWQVSRPCEQSMELRIRVRLMPPDSAAGDEQKPGAHPNDHDCRD